MENQLNRLLESGQIHSKNRERASQILNAVEGMEIWEARELLGLCANVLELLTVSYRMPHTGTAQQHLDDAFVDEIAEKMVIRLAETCRQCGTP